MTAGAGPPCGTGVLEHERNRAEHLGPLPELAEDDLHVLGGARDGAAPHRFSERLEQHVAGGGHAAADDDPLGVEQVAEVGDRGADVAAGVGERAPAAGVAVDGARQQSSRVSASPRLRRSSSAIAPPLA